MSSTISNEIVQRLGAVNLKQQEEHYSSVIGGKKYVAKRASQFEVDTSRHVRFNLDPISFVAGAFTNNPIVFRLPSNYCNEIEMVFLEWQVNETGGTQPVTLVAAPYQLDKIEIGANGDPTPSQIIQSDWLYQKWCLYNSEQLALLGAFNLLNMSVSTFQGETAIVANGSARYSIPLSLAVLNHLNPQTYDKDVIISVYPRASPISSGTGVPQLANMSLRFVTRKNDVTEPMTRQLYAKSCVSIPYINNQLTTASVTLTAGTMTEIPLSGIDALVAACCVQIRSSKAVAASAIRVFTALGGTSNELTGSLNIVDAQKISVLGSGAMAPYQIRSQHQALHVPGLMASAIPQYWIWFSDKPTQLVQDASNSGYLHFNGNLFLQLTPGTGFTTGTYIIDVLYLTYSKLELEKGSFRRVQ